MKVLKLSVQLTAVFLFILAAFVSQNVVAATAVFVNELHYDNSGADTGEAIEVAGPAGTDLAGWSIALYNGSNGTVYATVALSGVFADQNGGCGTLSFDHAGIQNGAPDGLALVDASDTVIQFLSYEGELTATDGPAAGMTSSDIGVSEAPSTPEGESLQLIGSGGMDTDFAWNAPAAASFGSVNAGQTFSCAGGDAAPTVSSSTPSNGATGVALDADVVINFSEDVTATDPWVAIECDMSGAHTTAVTGGPQSYTVNPDTDFVHGESCTVTITGSQVADNDSEDPPDTMASDVTISFETETVPVEADLVINEINADPDTELGDANGDGAAHFSDDEFVEIVNNSGSTVDLSGWTLADGFGVRHMFPAETVVPHGCAVVVFGGGTPTGEFGGAIVQTASDGALGLNNGGDSVVLNDGAADQAMATYGAEGGGNQSLTLSPDVVGTPPYVLHSEAAGSGGTLFSPGTAVDATPFASCTGAPADPNLLLSEIVVTPTGGEFVEILNPTSSPIDLSNVYLTDATFAGGSTYYYNIVTGSNAGGGGFGDFHARFPAGAMIGAGEYQTVAIAGSAAFATEYGQEPTYELYEDGEAADAIPDMVEALPGSINNQGGLTNGGEIVILYSWDGAADLVTDHDYVVWGDKAEAVDKTGVSVDGPDADSDVSAYQNDTAITDQDPIALDGHAFGNAWQREDNAEGAEIKSGGNGANGHDETSEDTSATWCESAPTPNGATVCGSLVVSEIMFDPASSESTWEWVEVYNGRSDAVDVAGYVLDNGDMTALGAANVAAGMIGAGETAVFFNADTLTANDFASAWGPGNYIAVSNWAELTNTGDQIGLWDSFASYSGDNETQANTVAQVSYMNAAPWPVNNDAASIFLTDLAADANDGANWSLSMVDGQTPAFTGFMSAAAGGNSGADIGSPSAGLPSVCGDPATPIHFIQGTGLASSEVGNVHTIEGVVVGDYQDTATELRGFYLQEEDMQADTNAATSEAIFVFDDGFGTDVALGDVVRVTGIVTEFGDPDVSLTELGSISELAVCSSDATVTPASVMLPVTDQTDWEAVEGMLVSFSQDLYVTEHFNLGRFGEVVLSGNSRLYNPTHVAAPGEAALAVAAANNLNRITLDDANTSQNRDPIMHPAPGLSADNTLRGGDTVSELTAVLDQRFGAYRLQPVGEVLFNQANPRTNAPGNAGGTLKVASLNVLNYFVTLDNIGSICGPAGNQGCRGADSESEFMRQRDKIVNALVAMDAHIVGLVEIENHADDAALLDLVAGLNAVAGTDTYAALNTGPIGTDAIKVAFIYQPAYATPVGDYAVLDGSVDPTFIDTKNRPVLAQTFMENSSEEMVTVAVNHLKSKGSACDDVGDPNLGDGQGNCNLTRTSAATAMANWLAGDPTGSGDPDVLITGDLNAYAMEDPVTALQTAGYSNLISTLLGPDAYSFVFAGEWGYLDHALANESLMPQVAGITEWHINADEPRSLDYNEEFKSSDQVTSLYSSEPYRASDHDPVIVGLNLSSLPYKIYFSFVASPSGE